MSGAAGTPTPAGTVSVVSRPPASGQEGRYITIDFDNVDIRVFIKFISELAGKNFVIDDNVKGKVSIISPRKISVAEAYKVFESVLDVHGYTTVPAGDVIKIIPAQDAKTKALETRSGQEGDIPREDRMVTQIMPLEHASPDEMKRILDPLISKAGVVLSYPPTGMLIVTETLSTINKLQEIIDSLDVPGVAEQVAYIPIQHADAEELTKSLTAVFQQQKGVSPVKLIADRRSNALLVVATEVDAERVRKLIALMDREVTKGGANLHVYRLQNATAEDLAKVLSNLPKAGKDGQKAGEAAVISRDVQVTFDKASNSLIITAGREDYETIEGVIKKLDIFRPMVYIESLIMEVNANKDFKVGVEWRGLKDTGHVTGFEGSQSAGFASYTDPAGTQSIFPGITTDPDTGLSSITSTAGGFTMGIIGTAITIGGIVFPNIGAVLQAYRTNTDVSILSTPQILTLDNEDAEINVGSNVPYLTRQETSTVSTAVNYNQYEYRDVGVYLKITPHISEDGSVRLKIDQQVTKVVSGADATLPTTLKRTAKTTVVVKDKETVVIGGLVGDSTELGVSKIPFFGDLPFIGWLFKTKSTAREKTNLFVFLTPHVIRTREEAAALSEVKRNEEAGVVSEGVVRMREKKPEKSSPGAP